MSSRLTTYIGAASIVVVLDLRACSGRRAEGGESRYHAAGLHRKGCWMYKEMVGMRVLQDERQEDAGSPRLYDVKFKATVDVYIDFHDLAGLRTC